MSLLENDTHHSDAMQDAGEMAWTFAETALEIINKQPTHSAINSNEVLSALITSQSIVYLGSYFIIPLIAELETIAKKHSDIAESADFIASEYEPKQFNKLSDIESRLIKDALTKHYLDSMTTPPEGQEHELAMQRIMLISKGMRW